MITPRVANILSDGPRIYRNDSTPELKAMWDHIDRMAARVPSWVGSHVGPAVSLRPPHYDAEAGGYCGA